MINLNRVILVCMFCISVNVHSEGYYQLGTSINYVYHDKSQQNHSSVDLKAGIGYEINNQYSTELEISLSSIGMNDGKVFCNTQYEQEVSCTHSEQIARRMLVASLLYQKEISSYPLFLRTGLAISKNSYEVILIDDNLAENKVVDEESKSLVLLLSGGYIHKEKHRYSGVVSNLYGQSDTGYFSHIGFEYNYLFDADWGF